MKIEIKDKRDNKMVGVRLNSLCEGAVFEFSRSKECWMVMNQDDCQIGRVKISPLENIIKGLSGKHISWTTNDGLVNVTPLKVTLIIERI